MSPVACGGVAHLVHHTAQAEAGGQHLGNVPGTRYERFVLPGPGKNVRISPDRGHEVRCRIVKASFRSMCL